MKNFTDPAVTLFQLPRSKLTEPLEHCSGAAVALLQSCWRNVPSMVWKNETAKALTAKRLQKPHTVTISEKIWWMECKKCAVCGKKRQFCVSLPLKMP